MKADYDLQAHNTLAVPARCKWFSQVENIEELQGVLDFAKDQACSVLPLGEGSNIVFAGFLSSVIVQNTLKGINLIQETDNAVIIEVGGGENWHQLVESCLAQGWYGIENLALIPGSVGAAPIQNIGAYGVELKDVFHSLTYSPLNTGITETVTFTNEQCQFGYRDSIFKRTMENQTMVLSLQLKLSKTKRANAQYPAVAKWIKETGRSITPRSVFDAVCALRRSKLPDPQHIPNAGSFFKNPVVSVAVFERLDKQFDDMSHYDLGNKQVKLAAGWMIEKAGWKGRDCDTTGMHKDQALVLVNPAKASGKKILATAQAVAESVEEMFGIRLEIEPRIYP